MIRKRSLIGDGRGGGWLAVAVVVLGCRSLPAQTWRVFWPFAVPPGFSMIAHPLNQGDNTIGSFLTGGIIDGTAIFKYDSASGTFSESVWQDGTWSDPTLTLAPGEGAFIYNPTNVWLQTEYEGTVQTGQMTNPIPAGLSIRSSMALRSGRLQTDLSFPAAEGDIIYRYNTNGTYLVYTYDLGSWTAEPVIIQGESFWVWKTTPTNWVQTFTFP